MKHEKVHATIRGGIIAGLTGKEITDKLFNYNIIEEDSEEKAWDEGFGAAVMQRHTHEPVRNPYWEANNVN